MPHFYVSLGNGVHKALERCLIRVGGLAINFHLLLNETTRWNKEHNRQVKPGLYRVDSNYYD